MRNEASGRHIPGASWRTPLTLASTSWPDAGNESGAVRDQTRRRRGADNAALAFDDFRGGLDDVAAGHVGRFGPLVGRAATGIDGNVDLSAMSQRPYGTSDYRVTLRVPAGRPAP